MKKFTAIALMLFFMLTSLFFVACGPEQLKTVLSNPLKQEISGLFEKTYYVNKSQDLESSTSGGKGNLNIALLNNFVHAEEENTLADAVAKCNNKIGDIYNNVYAELSSRVDPTGLINLTELNKRGLSSEMLRYNKLFLTTTQVLCDVLGDNIFTSPYLIQDGSYASQFEVSFDKIYHLNHKATNNGQFFGYVATNFKEYEEDKYFCSFVLFEAGSNGENYLRLGYLDTNYGLMMAELCLSGLLEDFETDTNAEVRDFKCAIFGQERYIITTEIDATTLIDFVKNELNFTKQTFLSGIGEKGAKKPTSQQFALMNQKMQNYNYESAYYQTSQVDVRASYTIPDGTTVVEQYSIPATKKVIIPKEVETIKGDPFAYPEYVEEIVFEDADNGALKTVGEGSNNFILNYTKVKNFVLPKTVEKLYLGIFNLITEMELVDISSCTNLTSKEFEELESSGKLNSGKEEFPRLGIYVYDFVKEFNYINTLKLPDANLRLYFSELGGCYTYNEGTIDLPEIPFDYETSANLDVPTRMNVRKNNVEENGFTFCTEVVGNFYYPKLTATMTTDTFMREIIDEYDKFGLKRYIYFYVKNVYAKESIYNEFKEYVESHTQNDDYVTFFKVFEVKMLVESWQGKALYCADGDGYIAKKLDGCTLDENNPDYDKILLSMADGKYGFIITLNDIDKTLTKNLSQNGGYSEVF
ncbi:MAG: hypothetical protein ACI4TI_02190, partial [Christensenellales bacterium]